MPGESPQSGARATPRFSAFFDSAVVEVMAHVDCWPPVYDPATLRTKTVVDFLLEVAAAVRVGIGKHVQLAVVALEAQVQGLRRPQNPHLGFAAGIRILPLPVGAEGNRYCLLPLGGGARRIVLLARLRRAGARVGFAMARLHRFNCSGIAGRRRARIRETGLGYRKASRAARRCQGIFSL